jgi:hypothetical protein
MTSLLDETVSAHGGMARWNELDSVRARIVQGGAFWALTGHEGELTDVVCTAKLHEQIVWHEPFGAQHLHSRYTPDRASIERSDGTEVEFLDDPRQAFGAAEPGTPWTNLQLVYFVGTSMWTYLTQPFTYTLPGFDTEEIDPWMENGERWRRLRVTWPDRPAGHSNEQTLFVGDDGLLRRFDYEIDIAGGTRGAHYLHGYTDISGIAVPKTHTIVLRNDQDQAEPEPVIVSIELKETAFKER